MRLDCSEVKGGGFPPKQPNGVPPISFGKPGPAHPEISEGSFFENNSFKRSPKCRGVRFFHKDCASVRPVVIVWCGLPEASGFFLHGQEARFDGRKNVLNNFWLHVNLKKGIEQHLTKNATNIRMKKRIDLPQCDTCPAREMSIFRDLNGQKIEKISQGKGCHIYKKGQVIFYEGNLPSGLFCLNQGKVKIYKIGESGKEQIVRLAKEGDVIGYRALISGEPYRGSAEALEDAVICHIPKETFFDFMQTDGPLAMRFMQLICQELGEAESRMLKMAQKSVRERLAEVLLILKEKFGFEEDEATLNISLTREDLANLVGTATETVIRLLSEFKEEGLVQLNGRKIKLISVRGLLKVGNVFD